MSEDTKQRKNPGRMKVWIGSWSGSTETNDLRFNVTATADPDSVRAVIAGLGVGDYDILTGRLSGASVKEVKRNTINIG